MEDDAAGLFTSEFLNFESTFDSLMDEDYQPGEQHGESAVIQFTPPLAEALMSTQLIDGVDLGLITGGNLKAHSDDKTVITVADNLDTQDSSLGLKQEKVTEGYSAAVTMETDQVTMETVPSCAGDSNSLKGMEECDSVIKEEVQSSAGSLSNYATLKKDKKDTKDKSKSTDKTKTSRKVKESNDLDVSKKEKDSKSVEGHVRIGNKDNASGVKVDKSKDERDTKKTEAKVDKSKDERDTKKTEAKVNRSKDERDTKKTEAKVDKSKDERDTKKTEAKVDKSKDERDTKKTEAKVDRSKDERDTKKTEAKVDKSKDERDTKKTEAKVDKSKDERDTKKTEASKTHNKSEASKTHNKSESSKAHVKTGKSESSKDRSNYKMTKTEHKPGENKDESKVKESKKARKSDLKCSKTETSAGADSSVTVSTNCNSESKCDIPIQEKINLAELKEKRMKNLAQKRKGKDDNEESSERHAKRRKEDKSHSKSASRKGEKTEGQRSSNDRDLNGKKSEKPSMENEGEKVDAVSDTSEQKSSVLKESVPKCLQERTSSLGQSPSDNSVPDKSILSSSKENSETVVAVKSPMPKEKSPNNSCETNSSNDKEGIVELVPTPPVDYNLESKSEDVWDEAVTLHTNTGDHFLNFGLGNTAESMEDEASGMSSFDEAFIDIVDKVDTDDEMEDDDGEGEGDDTITETFEGLGDTDIPADGKQDETEDNTDEQLKSNEDDNDYKPDINNDLNGDSESNDAGDKMGFGLNDSDDEYDSDLDDNEIYDWLEEGLSVKKEAGDKGDDQGGEQNSQLKEGEYLSREKLILEGKGDSPFEVLPEGWVQIAHNSGMPVYLHKKTRVITLSKPYFIGTTSVRKHDILLSAVPCLHYKRQLEKEAQADEEGNTEENVEPAVTTAADGTIIPTPVLKSAERLVSIGPVELHEYCKKLFQFKTVMIKTFKTWREKRVHLTEERKKEKHLPGLPSDTKLITCTLPSDNTKANTQKKKEFVLNPVGKTPVCILHEYTQHVLRVQPSYVFKEIENAEKPFKASILINGIHYGSGVASAKRLAKAEAAKATLEMFMPWLADQWKDKESEATNRYRDEQNSDLSYFEEVLIDDPRVTDLCDKAALPKPVQVLHECLKRNFGMGDTSIHIDKKMISNQRTEFSLTVGKHTATVVCKNKREGKQRAAQAMLKLLHPHLKNWASILRLYSKTNMLGFKEREEEAASNLEQVSKMKNYEILDKLKDAMRKLKAQRATAAPVAPGNIHSATQPIDL